MKAMPGGAPKRPSGWGVEDSGLALVPGCTDGVVTTALVIIFKTGEPG